MKNRKLMRFVAAACLVAGVQAAAFAAPKKSRNAAKAAPVHSASRTPIPAPSTIPSFTIGTAALQHLSVSYRDEGGVGEAKPFGVHGAEIRWEIRETPTENQDDLTHSEFSTRPPYKLAFTGDERGSKVYVCLRWENTRGEKGPWSAISSAVVP